MMGYVYNKRLIWIPVENNSCSSCISHEITTILSIIKIISSNTSIDDLESNTPYIDVFVKKSFSTTGEVSNITTQYILGSTGDPYGILIGKSPKLFFVTWFQYKSSGDIIMFIIRTLTFIIERRCISTFSLNYDVHVITCTNESRRSC